MDLRHIWENAAARDPHGMALIEPDARYTYQEIDNESQHLAASFQIMGIKAKDRVAILLKNRKEAIVSLWATQKIGAIFVPLNYHLSPADVGHCLRDAEPRAVIYEKLPFFDIKSLSADRSPLVIARDDSWADISYHELVSISKDGDPINPHAISEKDTAVILYTSGTTGRPKGVPRSHQNVLAGALAHIAQNRYSRYECLMGTMPLYHTMGLHALVAVTMLNGRYVISPEFNADLSLAQIAREKVDALYMIPTMYHALLRAYAQGMDVSSVHKLGYAGAAMSEELIQECLEIFGPHLYLFGNHYGSTEIYTHTVHDILSGKPGCAGKPGPDRHIKLVNLSHPQEKLGAGEIGEIWVQTSPEAFQGYWQRPDLTEAVLQDGWYHTGDLGYVDQEEDLFVVGRVDEMIISGGEHIIPAQVEDVLIRHPKVLEAAVTGEPDARWGQIVVAYIVPAKAGLTAQELDSFCKTEPDLALLARPRKYQFVRRIPKTPVGKVLRRELQNLEGIV
ncbi:MAG: 4-chlorobenzoate--CoA ligase [Sulfobacillus benefaciens]|uniref:4-chlorobenzoate--CoA ligase n=1 Tax=Sulfobacillus benefaciens TaxID=453960 RepID=A0A2T2WUI0_9FIRM|nr:MAG: 4-chlorobenzoate--CoA ligase [Sulfobacillus benefaciens]